MHASDNDLTIVNADTVNTSKLSSYSTGLLLECCQAAFLSAITASSIYIKVYVNRAFFVSYRRMMYIKASSFPSLLSRILE